jgi:nitrite reductase/ring-hydroxylating ferredoxin subunit
MSHYHHVCSLEDLKKAQTLGYEIEDHEGFLVMNNTNVLAYRNSCPHIGMNLEFSENTFLEPDGRYIQCAMHGALFEIDTGRCIHGPCLNQYLEPVQVKVEDDQVLVSI